jgi:hypothetical protein
MICHGCKHGDHLRCPEVARMEKLLPGRALIELPCRRIAISTGKVCDCAHQPGPTLAARQPR